MLTCNGLFTSGRSPGRTRETCSTAGNRGQYAVVIPSRDTVTVGRGLDDGKLGCDNRGLTREVLNAIPAQ